MQKGHALCAESWADREGVAEGYDPGVAVLRVVVSLYHHRRRRPYPLCR